ncbi:MAG TPA: PAS domain-containing protein [Gemmatimonadaceae bacterium]
MSGIGQPEPPGEVETSLRERLRAVQRSLDESQRLSLLGSWEWDLATGQLVWSDQTFRNFGLEPGSIEPTFDEYLKRLHPEDRELVTSTVQGAAMSGQPFDYYHRIIREDGEIRTLHARGSMVDESPASGRMLGTGQDVTEILRLQAEKTALATEAEDVRRNKFLSDATHDLYSTMDYETRLAELAKFIVPKLADWCAVDILQADDSFKRLAVVHSEPDKVRLAKRLDEDYPEDPASPTGRREVLKTGKPVYMAEITTGMIDAGARDEQHAKLIHSLGLRSFVIAPLIARGKKLGTLTVVMAESGRTFTQRDVDTVVEIARRSAVAIDNARLHQELQKKTNQLEELLEETRSWNETLTEQAVEMEVAQESLREAANDLEKANEELREAEARYRFLSDTIPVQVWTATPDGALDYVSQRTAKFFRRSQEEIVGSGWLDVVHPDDQESTIAAWNRSLATGDEYEVEFRLWSPADNAWVWHLGRAVPLRDDDGRIVRWFGSNTNMDALRRMSDEHERLKHEAQAANRAKMEFLAAMSHELRTPLNAINGYADLLLMEISGTLTDDQRNYITRVQRSGKFLLGLINDVLNFAKIDAGVLDVRKVPVDLNVTLDGIHALVEPQINAKQQQYKYESAGCDVTVLGDSEKIEQIVLNLLTNASKFTQESGSIGVGCHIEDMWAIVRVTDSGRGIPAEKLDSIFDPFVQVDRSRNSSSQQGVGLGLAISRELARAMDGDITVASTVGEGSTFTLRLRLAQ